MNKKHLHHIWRRVRVIKPQYFLAAAVIGGLFSIYALRQNNLHMITLRNDVYQADKDNGDVEVAIRNLRIYIYGHMNTSLNSGNNTIKPPIQLKYTYQRLQQAAQQGSTSISNDQLYTNAQHYCEQLFPHGLSGSGRIPCIDQYISSHNLSHPQAVDPSLYQFDFVSAKWSFDRTGWAIIATGIFTVLFATTFASERWLRNQSR